MTLSLNDKQTADLKAFLDRSEDAEQLSEREYVIDLYEITVPVSLDLVFAKNGVEADGAAELLYDEVQDGWYIGASLESADAVITALREAGAPL